MINLNDIQFFSKYWTMLKDTSLGTDDGESYMTDSMLSVIDFDRVKEDYVQELHLDEYPCSNDALFQDNDGAITFVEFKNGKVKNQNLKRKIYDSVLLLNDIIGTQISDLRDNAVYILVYNPGADDENNEDPKRRVQDSQSLDAIGCYFTGLGNEGLKKFGITSFVKFCFKEVHTFSPDQFEAYLEDHRL